MSIFLFNNNAERDLRHLTYPGAVVLGTLVAFPAATIDPSDKGEEELLLIDLQGLVFHHAPSASMLRHSDCIPRTALERDGFSKTVAAASEQAQFGQPVCHIALRRCVWHSERVCMDVMDHR